MQHDLFLDADRQALLLALTSMPVTPPPARYVKFGDALICQTCDLDSRYCKCAERSPSAPAEDGDSSDLAKRIADARSARGGR